MMRRAFILVVALLAAPISVTASEQDMLVVDDAVTAVVEQQRAGTDIDLAPVYDIVADPVTKPACRRYADAALAAFVLVGHGYTYPQSAALQTLFDYSIEAATIYRNDCLLAI